MKMMTSKIDNTVGFGFDRVFDAKKILWGEYIKICYNDKELPFSLIPKIQIADYDQWWGLRGFAVRWISKEIYFVFGRDKHGLYTDSGCFVRTLPFKKPAFLGRFLRK